MATTSNNTQLENFLKLATDSIQGAIERNHPIYSLITDIDSNWEKLLFGKVIYKDDRVASTLMIHGHNIFRACISTAISGHTAPVYCLLRNSLESCLYAYAASQDPDLGIAWLNRSKDPESRKKSKKLFNAPKIFEILNSHDPELNKECDKFYEALIDFGAHPNVEGVFATIKLTSFDGYDEVESSYLSGNDRETMLAAYGCVVLGRLALKLAIHALPARTQANQTAEFIKNLETTFDKKMFGL